MAGQSQYLRRVGCWIQPLELEATLAIDLRPLRSGALSSVDLEGAARDRLPASEDLTSQGESRLEPKFDERVFRPSGGGHRALVRAPASGCHGDDPPGPSRHVFQREAPVRVDIRGGCDQHCVRPPGGDFDGLQLGRFETRHAASNGCAGFKENVDSVDGTVVDLDRCWRTTLRIAAHPCPDGVAAPGKADESKTPVAVREGLEGRGEWSLGWRDVASVRGKPLVRARFDRGHCERIPAARTDRAGHFPTGLQFDGDLIDARTDLDPVQPIDVVRVFHHDRCWARFQAEDCPAAGVRESERSIVVHDDLGCGQGITTLIGHLHGDSLPAVLFQTQFDLS